MLLATVLAYLQLTLLPGLIIISVTPDLRVGVFYKFAAVFVASLSFNISLVLISLAFGGLGQLAIWLVIGATFAVLLAILGGIKRSEAKSRDEYDRISERFLFNVIAIVAIVVFFVTASTYFGSIVRHWDGLFVWDHFAQTLFKGDIAPNSGHYPPGLGALGAFIYGAVGRSDFTIVVAQLPAVFILGWLFSIAAVYEPRRWAELIGAMVLTYWVIYCLNHKMDGYAFSFTSDVFVAFASFATFALVRPLTACVADRPADEVTSVRRKCVLAAISGLGAGLAAMAKQSGVIMFPFVVLCIAFLSPDSRKIRMTLVLIAVMAFAFSAGVWYTSRAINVLFFHEPTNTSFLLGGVHQGRDIAERIKFAIDNMTKIFGVWICVLVFIGSLLTFKGRLGQLVWLVILIPSLSFYFVVSGYAVRNSLVFVPFMIYLSVEGWSFAARYLLNLLCPISIGSSAERQVEVGTRHLEGLVTRLNISDARSWTVEKAGAWSILVLLLIALTGQLLVGDKIQSAIETSELSQASMLGWRGTNNLLIKKLANAPDNSGLLTNYRVADRLPSLSRFDVTISGGWSPAKTLNWIEKQTGKNAYIFVLWTDRTSKEFRTWLSCVRKDNRFRVLSERFTGTHHILLRTSSNGSLTSCR